MGAKDSGDTSDRVFEWLEAAVLRGEIAFGEKLNEPRIARELSVSRGPVREAIRRLEEKRLVTRRPNQGARVIVPTVEGLLELFALREALEGMSAREAAEHASEAQIAEMHAVVRQDLSGTGNGPGQLPDLHILIARASRNELLCRLLCDDWYPLLGLYRRQYNLIFGKREDIGHEHERIVAAIAARDPEVAELLMRRHIRLARRVLVERLDEHGLGGSG